VWSGTRQVTISETGETEVVELTRPRFLIYTDAYFSWAFEPEEPRLLGDSDAEIAAAARAYDSAAGTYIRDGVNIVPWWQVLLALVVAMMLTGLG